MGLLSLGMRSLTFHAEAGRQQWKCVGEDPRGGGVKTLYKYSNSSSKPASFSSTNIFQNHYVL